VIVFPELSLSGYEPKLANGLAIDHNDPRFSSLQELRDARDITIGAGMPIRGDKGTQIGMIVFIPARPRQLYCKQFLHSDELPYFVSGGHDLHLDFNEHRLAPAICYESLLPEHAEKAFKKGATLYVASVAKSAMGLEKAERHYPEIAREYSMPVLMSNLLRAER
jgi:predicted amidohydrolase